MSLSQATDPSRNLVVGLQSILSTATDHSTTLVTQQQSLLPNPILTFIDSTLPYIYLPNVTCQNFEKTLGLEWNSTEELYLVNETLHQSLRSKNLTFTFTITDAISGGPTVQIELPYASFDLEVKPPYIQDTTRYFPLQPAVDESQYTLGRTFLQEASVVPSLVSTGIRLLIVLSQIPHRRLRALQFFCFAMSIWRWYSNRLSCYSVNH